LPLRVDWSNGRPRVYQVINPETGAANPLSPRLPTGQLKEWLFAWEMGFWAGKEQAQAEAQ